MPSGSKTLYSIAAEWKDFINIVEKPFIELSTTAINLAALQDSESNINITSDIVWTASSNQTWLKLNISSGTGKQTLT